jgi:hypothetical protein
MWCGVCVYAQAVPVLAECLECSCMLAGFAICAELSPAITAESSLVLLPCVRLFIQAKVAAGTFDVWERRGGDGEQVRMECEWWILIGQTVS